jgi:hypothetical protein
MLWFSNTAVNNLFAIIEHQRACQALISFLVDSPPGKRKGCCRRWLRLWKGWLAC